ncbi:MAG: HAMP domain-containing histidine kinase, partial [Erysipelotrichaceae bacterium]|nr:HAMP domain-containing histidine kinase [Erysipelotrichaceae bacterium]
KRFKSLNAEIFKSFLLFACSFMIILSLFQISFLDVTYRMIRITETKSIARKIDAQIKYGADAESMRDLVFGKDMSVIIFSASSMQRVDSNAGVIGDMMRRVSLNDVAYISVQLKSRDSVTAFLTEKGMRTEQEFSELFEDQMAYYKRDVRALLYAFKTIDSDGQEAIVIVISSITPVEATVNTLKVQLVLIGIIEIIIALLLSWILSKRLARPIEELTDDAKIMATGNYDVSFDSKGYSEIEELSDTLRHTASELKKADQMSKDLIANVSHDLRTPLTMISGYGELIRDIPQENTPENVQVIIDEAKRLASMVNNLLDISKLQSGNQQLTINDINAAEFIESVVSNYRKLAESLKVDIKLDCRCSDDYFKGDKERLWQVFANLLNNAVNHVGEDMEIIVNCFINEGRVRFEVVDHGEGIAKEDIDKIWERYYKVDKQHVRAQTGSGLGLSIVKTILEMHHAVYGVTSEPGEGSCFYFELPLLEKGEIVTIDE